MQVCSNAFEKPPIRFLHDVDLRIATIALGYGVVSDIAAPSERGGFVGALLLGQVLLAMTLRILAHCFAKSKLCYSHRPYPRWRSGPAPGMALDFLGSDHGLRYLPSTHRCFSPRDFSLHCGKRFCRGHRLLSNSHISLSNLKIFKQTRQRKSTGSNGKSSTPETPAYPESSGKSQNPWEQGYCTYHQHLWNLLHELQLLTSLFVVTAHQIVWHLGAEGRYSILALRNWVLYRSVLFR